MYTELEGQDRFDIIGSSAKALKGTSSMRLLRKRVTGKVFLAKFIARPKASHDSIVITTIIAEILNEFLL